MVNSAIYQLNVISEIYWKKTDLADLDSQFLKHLLRAHLIPEIRATITCLFSFLYSGQISQKTDKFFAQILYVQPPDLEQLTQQIQCLRQGVAELRIFKFLMLKFPGVPLKVADRRRARKSIPNFLASSNPHTTITINSCALITLKLGRLDFRLCQDKLGQPSLWSKKPRHIKKLAIDKKIPHFCPILMKLVKMFNSRANHFH